MWVSIIYIFFYLDHLILHLEPPGATQCGGLPFLMSGSAPPSLSLALQTVAGYQLYPFCMYVFIMISLSIIIEILYRINTLLCLIKVYSNTIELTVYTSFYCILDLLCVTILSGADLIIVVLKKLFNFVRRTFLNWGSATI